MDSATAPPPLSTPLMSCNSPIKSQPTNSDKLKAVAKKERPKAPKFWQPNQTVTFIIDREEAKQTFVIYKHFAAFYSPFFKKVFNNDNFTEGQTQTMRLEDIEAEVFGMLVHWLHTQSLSDCVKEADESAKLMILAKLWTLAGILALQDLASNWVRGLVVMLKGDEGSFREFIHYVCETREDTPLKRIAVDKLALQVKMSMFGEMLKDLQEGMLVDVAVALKKRVRPEMKSMNDPALSFFGTGG